MHMGKRGPKPTPTKDLEARGSGKAKRHARVNEIQVETLQTWPSPPEWLSDGGREHWEAYAQAALDEGLLTKLDVPLFAMFCDAIAEYVKYRDIVNEEGATVVTEHYTGAHPAAKLAMESRKAMIVLAEKCGHAVHARIGLVLQEKPKPTKNNISLFAKE